MTKSPRKNVQDVGIELGAAYMPSELASDRATAPGQNSKEPQQKFRLGMVSIKILWGVGLKPVLRDPNLALSFCYGSKRVVSYSVRLKVF